MIDFINIRLEGIYVHQVGNKLLEENITICKEDISFADYETEKHLLKYFLSPFSNNEVNNFSHTSELSLNEIYSYVKTLFADPKDLYKISIDIAKHLYEKSTHPKINAGELCVCYFKDCLFDDVTCNAIGLFKSEVKDTFLKFSSVDENVRIEHQDGININKLDKGCLIFDLEEENGYKVCVVDTKSKDTQYWKNDFLNIKPASDDYHHTNDFLNITKEYITNKLSDDFEVNKVEQIDLMNRSVDYFKKNDHFEKIEFEEKVLKNDDLIESFREFDTSYRNEHEIEASDSFEIAPQAVKKQAKIFKKILKLDKNFHIYIHGNNDLIEQGVEADGRKFYKIYYEEES